MKSLGYDVKKINKSSDLNLYKRIYSPDSIQNKRFYNIGAGNFFHPYWTNVDFFSEWYGANNQTSLSGIHYDLMSLEKLPIDSNTAEVVYSSHTVEHITDEAAQNMFNESFRILKGKGIFRITTPNINLEYRACKENDRDYFYWIDNYSKKGEMDRIKIVKPMSQASIEQIFLYHFAGNTSTLHADGAKNRISDEEFKKVFSEKPFEEALNYCTAKCDLEIQAKYPGNHINWWNAEKMTRMLRIAGFKNIYISGHGQSFCPVMRNTYFFDTTHPKISLYMEAVK